MKNLKTILKMIIVLNILFNISQSTFGQNANKSGALEVKVKNLKSTKGKLVVYLFKKGDDIMKPPHLKLNKPITQNEQTVYFKNLPYAEYVVMAFHDKNSNGKLDHSFIGFPEEPFGYSNNWNFSVFSGMPTWEKTYFKFSDNTKSISIRVK